MNNKKNAIIVAIFIVALFVIIALMGISGHIPFIGKAFTFIFAIILIIFILVFFILIAKRRK